MLSPGWGTADDQSQPWQRICVQQLMLGLTEDEAKGLGEDFQQRSLLTGPTAPLGEATWWR